MLAAKRAGQRVGLVPTMGNLHEGHMSLIRRARAETDFVVTTIFVNPIQFGPREDLAAYPRTPQRDRELCQDEGVDLVFAPARETMYPPGSCTRIRVEGLDKPLCGRHRPGHFVGVATVVAKLFNLVPADAAYFGLKDYQQAKVIERMVQDLNFPIDICLCPIVREPDGLAMSSRNVYLSARERQQALVLHRSLQLAKQLVAAGERVPARVRQEMVDLVSSQELARIDYVDLVDAETLQPADTFDRPVVAAVAVQFGKARLIDNITLSA